MLNTTSINAETPSSPPSPLTDLLVTLPIKLPVDIIPPITRPISMTPTVTVTIRRLEAGYKEIKKQIEYEKRAGEIMNKRVIRIKYFIADQEKRGRDVTELVKALETYAQSIDDVKNVLNKTSQLMSPAAGFDDNGKVTDMKLAGATLDEARKMLMTGLQTRVNAGLALNKAMKVFRKGAKP
jgi:hypothetical protein